METSSFSGSLRPDPQEAEVRHILSLIHGFALRQRARDGYAYELDVYLDAGSDALVSTWERFDPSTGVSYRTYAMHRVLGALHDAAASYRAWTQCHVPGQHAGKSPTADAFSHRPGPIQAWEMTHDLQSKIVALPPFIARIAQYLLEGWSQREIARAIGVHETVISHELAAWRKTSRRRRDIRFVAPTARPSPA